jgi:mono/diheme cytochrome c family protein
MVRRCPTIVKNARTFAVALALILAVTANASNGAPAVPSAATLARGKMLVVFGTCNDCHTPGWAASDGKIPVEKWMTGSAAGFHGYWGTSYPANVRLDFQTMTEYRWIEAVRTRAGHPPMVWEDLRALSDDDLRAIFQFIRSLGPAGVPAPNAEEPR